MALINKTINTMVSDGGGGRKKPQQIGTTAKNVPAVKPAAAPVSGSSNYNSYLLQQAAKPSAAPPVEKPPKAATVGTSTVNVPKVTVPQPSGQAVKQAEMTSRSTNYDLSNYIRQQQAAALEAELSGLKSAYLQSLADYDAAADSLPLRYDAARNAVAGQNAIAQMNFDERANATGLSSGARGQADLARSSVYRGTLAGIDQEQANAVSDIALTKANLQSQYETALAQAKANGDATLANALYQELVRVQGLGREDVQRAQNIALQYGLGKGDSLGKVASIRSIADLAGLIYGGSAARYTGRWTPSPVADEPATDESATDEAAPTGSVVVPEMVKNYNSAISYLESVGADVHTQAALMDQRRWETKKEIFNETGRGGAEVANYNSYLAYLRDYCAYAAGK